MLIRCLCCAHLTSFQPTEMAETTESKADKVVAQGKMVSENQYLGNLLHL